MIIYKTVNEINGKIYIGQDSKNNPSYLGSGKAFIKALSKYGKSNFTKYILEDLGNNYNQDYVDSREVYWISEYNSTDRNIGYNISGGGKNGYIMTNEIKNKIRKSHIGKTLSDATRKKISESKKGSTISLDTRKKMSISHKLRLSSEEARRKISERNSGDKNGMFGKYGKDNPNYGRIMPESERKKRCGSNNGMFGKTHSNETLSKMRKVVYQLDMNDKYIKEWKSAGLAASELSIPRTSISATCKNRMKSAGGFKWTYKKPIEQND